jgi:hypothetical protein
MSVFSRENLRRMPWLCRGCEWLAEGGRESALFDTPVSGPTYGFSAEGGRQSALFGDVLSLPKKAIADDPDGG